MSTSGSIDFSVSRDDIITEALELVGALAEGQSPSSDQITSMSRTLNMLVKAWQGEGLNLFALERIYVFLEKNKKEYLLGSTSTDHASTEYNRTVTTQAQVTTNSTVEVDDATGMSISDNIGIKLSDGNMQWSTIINVSSLSITLADPLTGNTTLGDTIYHYTSKSNRPMKIKNVVVSDGVSENDIPIWITSRQEYIELPQKSSPGTVNQVYYDPQITLGVLNVWPTTSTVDKYLTLWVQRTLEDFDSSSDAADFPQEWYLPLSFNLAAVSCTKYGVPRFDRTYIYNLAKEYKTLAESFDREDGFQLQPEWD